LWIGSNGGLVGIRGGQVERHDEAEGARPIVLSLLATTGGRLLVGTYRGLFELRAGRLIRVDGARDLAGTAVRSMVETATGSVWIGTENGMVEYRPGSRPSFVTSNNTQKASIPVIREARAGGLWLGLETGGIYRYQGGQFIAQDWAGPMGPIRDLLEDERGVLWIGGMGLGRLEHGRLVRFGAALGFAERRVHAMLRDGLGNLWISTNTGIYRVRLDDLDAFAKGAAPKPHFEPFRESEGVSAAEGNGGSQPAAWRTQDGRLWFATVRGLTGVDPAAAMKPDPPAVARIEAALIDGGRVERKATLPPGARRIEFVYTGLRLTSPLTTQFRYRLDPVDREWSDAGSPRSVAYARLAPGAYRFRVAAAGRDGLFHEDPVPFDFEVPPYFYERGLFRWGLLAAVFLFVLGGATLRVRELRGRESELERIVAEKTRDLERLASEDPLTGLANRRQFDRELEKEILRARRSAQPIALLMADVDTFKAYNDSYGHPQGDECLRRIASVLSAHGRRPGDLAARLGGEEFGLILPEMEGGLAETLAERVRQAMVDERMPHSSAPLGYVSLSIGVATVAPHRLESVTSKELVQAADDALYEAKTRGRNRVVVRPVGSGS
ncbi:MAG: diguanylate cyclase, partial [Vicinamibacteria bacterium]|nr:diguanylate cyclase [Vicinamibacteria bacterium]